ncbi:MAG: nuclear transport factor 2 family protein [Solirubrobacterales bacterium]
MEIVRRGYDAYNRGDLDGFGELLAPDAIAHPLPYWPEAGARHGREAILGLLREIREPLERNESAPEKLVDGDDQVVTAHLWRGVLKGTNDEVEARVGMVVTIRAGKIAELRWFRTFDDALEAAGLRE